MKKIIRDEIELVVGNDWRSERLFCADIKRKSVNLPSEFDVHNLDDWILSELNLTPHQKYKINFEIQATPVIINKGEKL